MLQSIALMLLLGMALGWLCKKVRLPGLVGMIATGMILGPYGLGWLDSSILDISSQLRRIALIIILLRAGLSLNLEDLKKAGRPAILMCFVPACFEVTGMIILAPILLGVSRLDAAIMGAVVGAVSPAVIVPRMIKLTEEGWGTKKSIPQLILAGASVDDFYHAFEKSAKENIPVICICITKKFSGSLQSATVAKGMIEEKYPQAKITVIDSTINTVLQGLFVLEACRLRDMGMDYEEIIEKILPIRETGRILFTVGSIDYLQHGGRIGKLAGIAAGALGIKPMITLKEGEIFSSGLARGRVRSMKKVVDMTREYLDEVNAKPGEYSFCIGYGYDYEEAVKFREMLKNLVKERLGIEKIGIYQIGATIGVHTGPYPIGIGIIKHAVD